MATPADAEDPAAPEHPQCECNVCLAKMVNNIKLAQEELAHGHLSLTLLAGADLEHIKERLDTLEDFKKLCLSQQRALRDLKGSVSRLTARIAALEAVVHAIHEQDVHQTEQDQ
jgi:hypothetical protein